jgi:hypothetical protein
MYGISVTVFLDFLILTFIYIFIQVYSSPTTAQLFFSLQRVSAAIIQPSSGRTFFQTTSSI